MNWNSGFEGLYIENRYRDKPNTPEETMSAYILISFSFLPKNNIGNPKTIGANIRIDRILFTWLYNLN
jgi:hypothetical protein